MQLSAKCRQLRLTRLFRADEMTSGRFLMVVANIIVDVFYVLLDLPAR